MSNRTIGWGQGLDFDDPNQSSANEGPVECLGKTFENDAVRREHYLGLLAEKLKDPEFRKIEGFPIGEDEDILNLSDPPYYTACPNPFVEEFIAFYGRPYDSAEEYKREPYAADVSEGKNHPIYMAHSYHTKVPHKAVMRYILHYTEPNDLVFDGFCGTGMTGVAAELCGDVEEVESLGYKVLPDGSILQKDENENGNSGWVSFSKLGVRRALLCDLAPAATFIAQNYNTPKDKYDFEELVYGVLDDIESEFGWLYTTKHNEQLDGEINYVVWSDVYGCPECSFEMVFWDVAVDRSANKVNDKFFCPNCSSQVSKRSVSKIWYTQFDKYKQGALKKRKLVPVLINYSVSGQRYEKKPDAHDLLVLKKIEEINPSDCVPSNQVISGKEIGRLESIGVHYVNQLLPERSNIILSEFLRRTKAYPKLLIAVTAVLLNLSWMYRWRANGKGGITSGTYYICATPQENNAFNQLRGKIKAINKVFLNPRNIISTQDSGQIAIPDNSLDYLFFDPPFGANLMYSELSFLWESWLRLHTNNKAEAIENPSQDKGVNEYRVLMNRCFKEAFRVLKPGRWITVEFSNTKSSIWNSIQLALTGAGFIIANISALDKKQGSFKAVTTSTAVKQDLVISAYKPNGGFNERFIDDTDEAGVWDFIRTHLSYLPVIKKSSHEMAKIPERDPRILFDQVVAYFVRNLRDVPVSSKEFQEGLKERFSERDGMVFLPNQVAEYDKARLSTKQLKQLSIFVDDEASAIEWLRQVLNEKPQSYQDVHPKYINELSGWKNSEAQIELYSLLEQNFIKYDAASPIPPQIHSYLSTNFKALRNLSKDDLQLIQKAKDRWYVPNPAREEDLQKLRDRSLLREFEEYKKHSGKILKKVRVEAVRCGFKIAWKERDYLSIINVAEKMPQDLLQEDSKLLMWYDQAQTRANNENLF
jgi:hypothetical protein